MNFEITDDTGFEKHTRQLECLIQKATIAGGTNALQASEQKEIGFLSLAIEHYEDKILKIMPLKLNV